MWMNSQCQAAELSSFLSLALQASFAIEIGLEWLHKVYTKQLLAASWCVSAVLCNSKHAARSDPLNYQTLPKRKAPLICQEHLTHVFLDFCKGCSWCPAPWNHHHASSSSAVCKGHNSTVRTLKLQATTAINSAGAQKRVCRSWKPWRSTKRIFYQDIIVIHVNINTIKTY